MFCSQCGSENPDAAAFCVKCGKPFGAPSSAPQQPQVQPPAGVKPAAVPPPQIESHMLGAILSTLFCCLPFGIIAIIYAAQVSDLVAAGNYAAAAEKSAKAKNWIWAAIICNLLGWVITVASIVIFVFYSTVNA